MNNIKLFNTISNTKYKIKKDDKYLYIKYNNNKLKCAYIFLMIAVPIDDTLLNIIWSDSNPYIDIKTRDIVKNVRDLLRKEHKYILDESSQIITNTDLKKIYNDLIKNPDILQKINQRSEWIITNNNKNYIEYFIITEII